MFAQISWSRTGGTASTFKLNASLRFREYVGFSTCSPGLPTGGLLASQPQLVGFFGVGELRSLAYFPQLAFGFHQTTVRARTAK